MGCTHHGWLSWSEFLCFLQQIQSSSCDCQIHLDYTVQSLCEIGHWEFDRLWVNTSSLTVLHLVAQSCLTLCDPMNYSPPGSSVHWDYPCKNTGVGHHALLQGIFPTQGSKLGLLHWRWIFYHLSRQGSLRILEWVAYPFSRGSSGPRIWTRVSCIAGGFCTSWIYQGSPSNLTTCLICLKRSNDLFKPAKHRTEAVSSFFLHC